MSAKKAELDPRDPPAPRRALPTKDQHRGWKVFGAVVTVMALVGASAVVYYLWRVDRAVTQVARVDTFAPPSTVSRAPSASPATSNGQPPMTFVLLGTDARGADGGRSDSLMVAYITGDRKNVYLTSFPRDLWVEIPNRGYGKINAAYSYGGPALTMLTLEKLLGVRMDHSAVIDFEGFIRLTDVLGGVEVNNRHASCWEGYCWPQGKITIQGNEALAYVRQRYNLPNGDLDRAERQREVVKAIGVKAASGGVLGNPTKFAEVMDKLSSSVKVDPRLGPDTIKSTAMSLKITGGDSIGQMTAPFLGSSWSDDGQWIEVVDQAGMAELGAAMRSDQMQAYYEKHKFEVPNYAPYGTKPAPANAETPPVPVPTAAGPGASPQSFAPAPAATPTR